MDHLTSNKLLNPHHSASCKHPNSSCIFTIISSMQQDHKKYQVFAPSTSLLPLTTSTIESLASYLGSVFMALFSTGSSPTHRLAAFVSNVTVICPPCTHSLAVFPTAPFLYSSSCTLLLSVLLSPSLPGTTTFMQTTLNYPRTDSVQYHLDIFFRAILVFVFSSFCLITVACVSL